MSYHAAARNFFLGAACGVGLAVVFVDQLLDAVYTASYAVKDLLASVRASPPSFSYAQQGPPPPTTVEVTLGDVASADSAIKGGATSLEVCGSRSEGGVTPSTGLVREIVGLARARRVEVHVLVRPRPGDFVYSSLEFDVMARDILAAKAAGATGVVTGVLLPNGDVDVERMRVVRALSAGMCLTFHRAFDVCRDGPAALQAVVDLRCDRLLTSGRCRTALEGLGRLHGIVTVANAAAAASSSGASSSGAAPRRGLLVVAACGVDATNAATILRTAKVHGVHAGSSVAAVVDDADKSGAAAAVADFSRRECVSEEKVRRLVEACQAAAGLGPGADGALLVPELAVTSPVQELVAAPAPPAAPPLAPAPDAASAAAAAPAVLPTVAAPAALAAPAVFGTVGRSGSPALDETYVHVGDGSASPVRPRPGTSILSSLFGRK